MTDDEGYMLETASEIGFKTDDDMEIYTGTLEQMLAFAKAMIEVGRWKEANGK
jgi:hypothetical protein